MRAPDFNQWLTRIHGFKVGTSRNSYTTADLEAAWNAAERAWMEVANKNAQERNAAVDREVVLLEALRLMVDWFGAAHEEACPKDDTCHCEGRPINDAVNAAIRSTQPPQPQIGLLKNTMQPWIKKVYAALEADEAEAAIKQAERT